MKNREAIIKNMKQFAQENGLTVTKTYTREDHLLVYINREEEWDIDDIVEFKQDLNKWKFFEDFVMGIGNLGDGTLIIQVFNKDDIDIWD